MKIISKEKAWLGHDDMNFKLYCFEEINDNYTDSPYNYYKLLSDIIVNEYNEIHSFNDEPLIYKDEVNILCKEWFVNGTRKRLNPEKPYLIAKGHSYYFNDGSYVNYLDIKEFMNKKNY